MKQIASNPHTHTNFVDGRSTAEEMAARAFALGFTSLGFSEHARQLVDAEYGLSEENERAYIRTVRALREQYAGRMRVWLGMEKDRLSPADRGAYEYALGANHYLARGGDFAAVDGDADRLEAFVSRHMGGSWEAAVNEYFDEYAGYVQREKPDIIAHFDLICKQNRGRWFDENGPMFLCAGKAAMRRMIGACHVMEVNTGGIARSGQPCPYPAMPLLKYWRALGGEVIPASDCHRAHQMDAWFDRCPAYIMEAGYTSMLALGTGSALFARAELA